MADVRRLSDAELDTLLARPWVVLTTEERDALVDDLRGMRDLARRALPYIDPNDDQAAYELVLELEAVTAGP